MLTAKFIIAISERLKGVSAITSNRFVRNVATVASGTAVAQAITLAFYPIISRVYGPTAFGVVGVFMSAVSILAPLAAFAYPIAIVLPKDHADAKGLIRLSLIIAGVSASLGLLLIAILSNQIVALFKLQQIAPFVLLLPVVLLFQAMQDVAQQWLIRTKQFSLSSRVVMLQALLINGAKAGLGLLQPLAVTLVLISAAGFALQAVMLTLGARWFGTREDAAGTEGPAKTLPELAHQYRDFPLFRAPQDLLNALSHGLPVILLAGFYGPAIAGLYALSYSVLAAPVSLLGNAVGNVLYPRLAEAARNGEDLRRLVLIPTGGLLLTGLAPFGTIMLFGPPLFAWVFGEEWREAGEYARWLALWMTFLFFNMPSNKAIPVIGLQHLQLGFGVFSTLTRLAALWAGYHFFGKAIYSIALYNISGAVLNILMVGFVVGKCGKLARPG